MGVHSALARRIYKACSGYYPSRCINFVFVGIHHFLVAVPNRAMVTINAWSSIRLHESEWIAKHFTTSSKGVQARHLLIITSANNSMLFWSESTRVASISLYPPKLLIIHFYIHNFIRVDAQNLGVTFRSQTRAVTIAGTLFSATAALYRKYYSSSSSSSSLFELPPAGFQKLFFLPIS